MLQDEFFKKVLQQEIKWKQRSRIKWLDEGDRNTKYFHGIACARRHVNRITAIFAQDQIWESRQDIQYKMVSFFRNLNTREDKLRPQLTRIHFKQLSPVSASLIEEDFSMAEIQEAVFGLVKDRAPGPNGFPIEFFQQFWDLVKGELL